MAISRRNFFGLTARSAICIGLGHSMSPFSYWNGPLPGKDERSLRFAVASDGHYGQLGTQYESLHREMRDWLLMEKEQVGLDFTMINGDLLHDEKDLLPQVKSVWDLLKMPYYVSHGNHDKIDEAGWVKTWNIPWHHSFTVGDAAFLILNTADQDGKYVCPDLNWTRDELKRYGAKKHLFVFMHITPFTWTPGGMACPDLVELFDRQKNLRAVFHGHDHDQDGVKDNQGKLYFFDSHIGGNWGTAYQGYRIIEILKSGQILTYQINPLTKQKINDNRIQDS
jgi:3',5'-cyclic-AMP phosphodiesterase